MPAESPPQEEINANDQQDLFDLLVDAREGSPEAAQGFLAGVDEAIQAASFAQNNRGSYVDHNDRAQTGRLHVFTKMIREGHFDSGNLLGFVYRIARRKTLDTLRREQRIRFIPTETLEIPSEGQVEITASERTTHELLKAVITKAGCTERQAQLVLLHHVHGYSYKEIAELLGIELGTVKSGISRGLYTIRENHGIIKGQRPSGPLASALIEAIL